MLQLTFLLALGSAHIAHTQQPQLSDAPVISGAPIIRQRRTCPVVLPLPSSPSQRVLGGQPVQHDDQLFQAWLLSPNISGSRTLCSATRLSKHWVMTAAHCLVTPQWSIDLAAPSVNGSHSHGRIESVYKHPNFTGVNADPFDFALLRIMPPPWEPLDVPFVRLNAASWLPVEGAFVRVSGYGIFGWNASNDPSQARKPIAGELHFVDIPIHRFSPCNNSYSQLDFPKIGPLLPELQVCAGYVRNGCNQCSGDSGGPLLQYDRLGRAVQVAIATATFRCVRPRFPGIYVRVSAALGWFRSVGAVFETAEPEQVFRKRGTEQEAATSPVASDSPGVETPALETPAFATPVSETPASETPVSTPPALATAAVANPALDTAALETLALDSPAFGVAVDGLVGVNEGDGGGRLPIFIVLTALGSAALGGVCLFSMSKSLPKSTPVV